MPIFHKRPVILLVLLSGFFLAGCDIPFVPLVKANDVTAISTE